MRKRHNGFTLIELVVVIGIITLLTGILLPVLGRAKAQARSVQCLSNLRQLGQGMGLYANDNTGYVPRGTAPPWRVDTSVTWWGARLARYVGGADSDVLQCPSHPLTGEIPAGYVVNAFRIDHRRDILLQRDWDVDGPVRLAKIKNSSQVAAFIDAATEFPGDSVYDDGTPYNDIRYLWCLQVWTHDYLPLGPIERMPTGRHREDDNVLMFDSSAERLPWKSVNLRLFDDGIDQRGEPVY